MPWFAILDLIPKIFQNRQISHCDQPSSLRKDVEMVNCSEVIYENCNFDDMHSQQHYCQRNNVGIDKMKPSIESLHEIKVIMKLKLYPSYLLFRLGY